MKPEEIKAGRTRQQLLAQHAFSLVKEVCSELKEEKKKEYGSFAKRFPSLIQTCGLVQALSFALASDQETYLLQLAQMIECSDTEELARQAREAALLEYQHLSLLCLEASVWLKRYVEACLS